MYYSNPYMGYRYINQSYDQNNQPSYKENNPKELNKLLKMIKEAIKDEKEDELFYDYLIKLAPTQEEREIISSIRDDELKHNKMLRQIYKDYTGKDVEDTEIVDFQRPRDYIEGIIRALFGELKAVEKYREIRQGLTSRHHRDMLFEIITDELKHSSKYNYIYAKNRTDEIDENFNGNGNIDGGNGFTNRTGTSSKNLTIDEWENLIEPLMEQSDNESREIILASILVGSGCPPNDAIKMVNEWEKSKKNGK